jgi:hypothetical protein
VSYGRIAILAVNFVPFGKVLNKVGAQKVISATAEGLLKQVYKLSGKSGAVGDVGALMAVAKNGFKRIGFKTPGPGIHGFDDIVEDASGHLVIVEAKGGGAQLERLVGGEQQMSQKWIQDKVNELRAKGEADLADRVQREIDARTLKAMLVKTKVVGKNAFNPKAAIKNWDDIGFMNWRK